MDRSRSQVVFCLLTACSLLFSVCSVNASEGQCYRQFSLPSMGTFIQVKWLQNCADTSTEKIQLKVKSLLDSLEGEMSLYQSQSKISQLNRTSKVQGISNHFYQLVKLSIDSYKETKGAFNILILPVLQLYKEKSQNQQPLPTEAELVKLKPLLNIQNIRLKKHSIEFLRPGMKMSLDGIAKGYTVDQVGEVVESFGFSDYLVNFSGNILAQGHSLEGSGWRIDVKDIETDKARHVVLKNEAIATSGSEHNQFQIEGKTLHHIINPKTLKPSSKTPLSKTVRSKTATRSDMLATARAALGK